MNFLKHQQEYLKNFDLKKKLFKQISVSEYVNTVYQHQSAMRQELQHF